MERHVRVLLPFALLLSAVLGVSSTAALAADNGFESVPLPPGVVYPNGVAVASDGTLYVGQVTHGGVHRRAPDGRWSLLHPGSREIYAGTALRLDEHRHRLWGASPDFLPPAEPRTPYLFALDTRTGRTEVAVPVSDGFVNDIAVEPDGSVLVTESRGGRLLRLSPGATTFETLLQDSRLTHPSGIGAAGIARSSDGVVVIGNFSTGRLYAVTDGGLRELALPRAIENADGMAFAPDGSLLVTEGAAQSGNGRLLRVADPLGVGPRGLDVLADRLESPVNVSVAHDTAYVTEARIRHRIVDGLADRPAPQTFRIVAVPLP